MILKDMEWKILYLQIILSTYVCSGGVPQAKIISGKPATIQQFPFIVSLRERRYDNMKFGDGHRCGGTLVTPTQVLSAAHCFFDGSNRLIGVNVLVAVMGVDKLEDKGGALVVDFETYMVHSEYSSRYMNNDIAIVVLLNPVPDNHPVIRPAYLSKETPKPGTTCHVTGWGRTSFDGPVSSKLLTATVPVVAKETCEIGHPKGTIMHGMLCAGGSGSTQDACQGDSGGPLTEGNVLVGIVSWGKGCGDPNSPGVYTNVYDYLDWILNNGIQAYSSKAIHVGPFITIYVFCIVLSSLSRFIMIQ